MKKNHVLSQISRAFLRKRQLHTLFPLPNDKVCPAPRFWAPHDQLQPVGVFYEVAVLLARFFVFPFSFLNPILSGILGTQLKVDSFNYVLA